MPRNDQQVPPLPRVILGSGFAKPDNSPSHPGQEDPRDRACGQLTFSYMADFLE